MKIMHELSLLRGAVDVVEEAAAGRPVEQVGMVVGTRSGVLIDALQLAWPIARAGTCCAEAELIVEEVVATVWCPACQAEQEIDEYFALTCPQCGTPTADLRRGKEFQVAYVEVGGADEDSPGTPPATGEGSQPGVGGAH